MCSVAHVVTKLTPSYGAGGIVSLLCVAGCQNRPAPIMTENRDAKQNTNPKAQI